MANREATVVAVSRNAAHTFSKQNEDWIVLRAGLGVEGDAHWGATVQHRSRVARDPTQPNYRQVHLIHAELHDELREMGFVVAPGELGENITTRGVDLLALPTGTRLSIGEAVILAITGLRNPCHQLDGFNPGLMQAVLGRDLDGALIRKSGVMAVVVVGGGVAANDPIKVEMPAKPYVSLKPV